MKRIAIFIDGTWNTSDAEFQTNVVMLSRCVLATDRDGQTQQVIYSSGVGSGRGNTWIARRLDRTFGGALGWGLLDIIQESYRNLIFAYQPGDEIYIFGFSRGGFAARSLAGLIRCCGIPPRRLIGRVPEAMARYISRDPAHHPDDPSSFLFRADYAPDTATSPSEFQWRRARGDTRAIHLTPAYLGIWDTVAALGLPGFLPGAERFNAKYRFHDAKLSSSVQAARHAIAIDEQRSTFPASPWDNIQILNEKHGPRPDGTPRFAQQWFPGDHGSVGGGGPRTGLSSLALYWIAKGAEKAGLHLSWEEFDALPIRFDPCREALCNREGALTLGAKALQMIKTDRPGPDEDDALSLAALDRMTEVPGYRPPGLRRLTDKIGAMTPQARAALRAAIVARDGGPTYLPGSDKRPV